MKKLFLIGFLAIFAWHSHASEVRDIAYADFINANLPSDMYPQLFLFDKQGQLIHYNEGLDRALKRRFNNKNEHYNSKSILLAFESIVSHQTNDADFTLYTITRLKKGGCPPCMKQEEITNKVIASLPEKTIHSVVLDMKSPDINSLKTKAEIKKHFPNVTFKKLTSTSEQ